ncbi:MAG: PspC domain-containing protein [Bacteroidaceae bacterium]|nr:PspC domain-containing protein [Bacteroidaceae bacterium]
MIKKNISINYAGRLYNIDEDAYEMLMHYSETIHRYFKAEGSEEVADDIDMRIAELFDERLAAGANAITIEMVEPIIRQIGDLDQIIPDDQTSKSSDSSADSRNSDSDTDQQTEEKPGRFRSRRMYRDVDNKVLCGVFSGFGQYFNVNPMWFRLVFVVLLFMPYFSIFHLFHTTLTPSLSISFNGWLVLLYIAMAIIMPTAQHPEDKLRMQGRKVTPQNLADEVAQQTQTATEERIIRERKRTSFLGNVFRIIGACLLLFFGTIACVLLLAAVIAAIIFTIDPDTLFHLPHLDTNETEIMYQVREIYDRMQWVIWIGFAAAFNALGVMIYCCFHGVASSIGSTKPMSVAQRLMWFVWFIISAGVLIGACVKFSAESASLYTMRREADRKENTIDGHYFNDTDKRYFKRGGWKLLRADNLTDDRYTYSGEHYNGDYNTRYLDAYSYDAELIYQAERTDSVAAGVYTLSCAARQARDCRGAYIYIIIKGRNGSEETLFSEIEADGTDGGDLGKGWNTVEIRDIYIPQPSTVRYGVSTDPKFTGCDSRVEWFSACDFKLEKK